MKKGFVFLYIFMTMSLSYGQDRAIGVRFVDVYEGKGVGFSFKQKIKAIMSFEATVGVDDFQQSRGFFKADFNPIQRSIPIEGLDWYLGAGVQGWFSTKVFEIGPEAILGLSYDFSSLPLNLFLDGTFYAPLIDDIDRGQVWQIGCGARLFIK